jgi:hypothetical protein
MLLGLFVLVEELQPAIAIVEARKREKQGMERIFMLKKIS